jgi:3-phenylpropionate/cinnamic acid dioxygenase small subunit
VDDEAQIRALLHEYAFRLDAGDLDGVAALFEHAEMGAVGTPGRARGIEGARRNYDGVILYADGTPRTQHVISNVTIRVDGAAATARSYFTVLQQLEHFPLQVIIAGAYHDRFAGGPGAWHFVERLFDPRLFGDLSHHLHAEWTPDR